MGWPQKVFRDAVSKNALLNILPKKLFSGKIAIPTFLTIFFLYIHTVKPTPAQTEIEAQEDLLFNFLFRLER